MSIYTITLKRELLDEDEGERADAEQRTDNDFATVAGRSASGGATDDSRRGCPAAAASEANEFNLNEANWLDCSCELAEKSKQEEEEEEANGKYEW